MNNNETIHQHFLSSIQTKQATLEQIASVIAEAGAMLASCVQNGGKILCCGNGGSAGDAQHFSGELLGRYVKERRPLAAISLHTDTTAVTAIANDYGYEHVFARQIAALGTTSDVLLAITTSGNSANILHAITAAHKQGMRVLALTGKNGGKVNEYLRAGDLHVCVPATVTAHIQEVHITILHCWCGIIDQAVLMS